MYDALNSAWEDVKHGENLDVYVALLATIVFLILDLIGVGDQWITSIIVAALAILLLSTLMQRKRDEALLKAIQESQEAVMKRDEALLGAFQESRVSILLETIPSEQMKQDIVSGKDVWLIGIFLRTTGDEFLEPFRKRLKEFSGYTIHILVSDPDGHSIHPIAFRSKETMNSLKAQDRIRDSLSTLCNIRGLSPNVEIRVIDLVLPFGLIAADINADEGVIYYEQYPFKSDDKPVMVFHPSDPPWYGFYRDQIQLLWDHARRWECPKDASEKEQQ